ncbi:unnamed protein product [Leptidea sinapis]|uniref:Uncharacterized protein n=1 Tax=Leptidea sinapis TaxID=189913 RepID=A0A5E4Q2D1_9NEOP|nr:unnamed protein product [Leptidea sinapis]
MILLASSFQLSLVTARAQFVSHVHVATPAHSYSHGVGDLVDVPERPTRGHSPLTRDFQSKGSTNTFTIQWLSSISSLGTFPSRGHPFDAVVTMETKQPYYRNNNSTSAITLQS